jgi:hypothetical protein
MDVSSLSHTRWECQYRIVFIPIYRREFANVEIGAFFLPEYHPAFSLRVICAIIPLGDIICLVFLYVLVLISYLQHKV